MLERVHGPLPMTLRQITGGGGQHWIFRSPAGVEIRQGSGWWDGVDSRTSAKGYLLVAPSVTTGVYTWLSTIEPVEAPAWLIDVMKVKPEAVQRSVYVPPAKVTTEHLTERERGARRALAGIARKVSRAVEGCRNELLNWGWWKALGYRDVIPESEIRTELTRAGKATGLGEVEIAKVLR
jgi:hypothetical protein